MLVPFGANRAAGFVLGEASSYDAGRSAAEGSGAGAGVAVRDILKVLDDEPAFSEGFVQLARFVSETYCCPIQSVLRAMLPPGTAAPGRKVVRVSSRAAGGFQGALTPTEALLLEILSQEGDMTPSEIAGALGVKDAGRLIRGLAARGLVEVDTYFRRPPRPRPTIRLWVAGGSGEDDWAAATYARLKSAAPRQAELFRLLAVNGGPMELGEALKRSGAGRSSLSALVKAGLVRMEHVESSYTGFRRPPALRAEAIRPTRDQALACETISSIGRALRASRERAGQSVVLLHGITGSGKTEVYLRAIEEVVASGMGAVMLVPEVALTPQMVQTFTSRLGDGVAVLHSGLSQGERFERWQRLKQGEVRIAVGARSAVFAPVRNPGIIIVDEEHENTYKQSDGSPKYHARDVALARGRLEGCPVVLGSATPSVESYFKALSGEYRLVEMKSRVNDLPLPETFVVDMREELKMGNRSIFSRALKDEAAGAISRGEQVILFLNRRGFSTFVLCRECGFVMRCPDCDVSLTYHASGWLKCHYCGHARKIPDVCPNCGGRYVRLFGAGTERVEDEAKRCFPNARILRMDLDTTSRKGSHEAIVRAFSRGEADVLVGTQMVAKGLDFPNVTVVGVVSADITLNLPDFRSCERTFQLITQVAGRAGRGRRPGKVIVQTYDPDHYSISTACRQDYPAFYETEIVFRREAGYPPFTFLAGITFWSRGEAEGAKMAREAADVLGRWAVPGLHVLGPSPAPFSRMRGWHRWQVVLKSEAREALSESCRTLVMDLDRRLRNSGVRVTIDIDPVSML